MPESFDVYPNGFVNVRVSDEKTGIKLGIWQSWTAPLFPNKSLAEGRPFVHYRHEV